MTRFRHVAAALLAVPALVLAGCESGGSGSDQKKSLDVFAQP